jgi:phage terminase large subunit
MPRTVAEQFRDLGLAATVLPVESNIQPGIEACRVAIGASWFDGEATRKGRSAISAYRREYDDKRGAFKLTPLHDWASNGADGFRYAVQAINKGLCDTTGWGKPLDYSQLNRAAI